MKIMVDKAPEVCYNRNLVSLWYNDIMNGCNPFDYGLSPYRLSRNR